MIKRESDDRDWSEASDSLFRASRADHDPTVQDHARVRLALARRLASSAPLTADAGTRAAATKALRGATLGNVVKFSLGVAFVAAGVFVTREEDRRPARPEATELVARAQPALAAQPTESSRESALLEMPNPTTASPARRAVNGVSARTASPRIRADGTAPNVARSESDLQPRSDTPLTALHSPVTKATRAESNPSAGSESSAPAMASSRSVSATQPEPVPTDTTAPTAPPKPTHDDQLDDVRAELALVKRIHLAMRNGNPAEALALCVEHERRWPRGTFAQEREGVRAIASCESGATAAGRLARAFLAKYPHATLAPRVTAACAAQLGTSNRDRSASGVE